MWESYFKENNLTRQQIEAVKCKPAPTIVIAGAGSGKTSVIAHRFIYLQKHFKIDPAKILCVTFTNAAVKNLRDRILRYSEDGTDNPLNQQLKVMTFHALCKGIITDAHSRGSGAEKKPIHSSKCLKMVREILQGYPHIKASYQALQILERLRHLCKTKDKAFSRTELARTGVRVTDITDQEKLLKKFPYEDMMEIYVKFDEALKKANAMTLDDILLDARIFLQQEKILKDWAKKYDAILCDEFQDVDDIQFEVLTKLCRDHNNLFCVGDPDQSIYGFRGSLPKVFRQLRQHFDALGIYTSIKKLEQNFRSTPQILNVANQLLTSVDIEDDLRKNLFTNNTSGPKPTLDILSSQKLQAQQVVRRIRNLQADGVNVSEIVVLGRNKAHYRFVKDELMYSSISYEDWKEILPLMKNVEIKDLVCWIGVGFCRDNPQRWANFLKRVYARPSVGVGPSTFLKFYAGPGGNLDVFQQIKIESHRSQKVLRLLKKIERVQEIADNKDLTIRQRCWEIARFSGILEYHAKGKNAERAGYRLNTMQKFLDSPMIDDAESWDEAMSHVEKYLSDAQDRVVCSTIHGVKGLEFSHVFLVSMSEGKLPSSRGLKVCNTRKEMLEYIDEERRLLYVACTRAKKTLHIFSDKPELSPFIKDIRSCLSKGVINLSDAGKRPEDDPYDDEGKYSAGELLD